MLHISIKPDTIFTLFGFPITNTLLTGYILIIIFFIIGYNFKKLSVTNPSHPLVFIIRYIFTSLHNLLSTMLGDKVNRFFPYLVALFLYIIMSNWLGLLPGIGSVTINLSKLHPGTNYETATETETETKHETVKAKGHEETKQHIVPLLKGSTADLNTTLALALITMALIQYYGILYCGLSGYIKKFINFANPMAFFTGILEIISEISKVISFAFRLFGNIFAGEVLLAVVAFLIPFLVSFPFLLLEVFVGFVQALVFTMLASVFLQVAITKHH